jgi:multidrug resistance efflux pump
MSSFLRAYTLAGILMTATLGLGSSATTRAQEAGSPAQPGGEAVYNTIEGETTLLSIKPAGSWVKKGEMVCELESFALRSKLASQELALKVAESPYQTARLSREAAELAVNAYLNGTYKQQIQKLESEITLADLAVKRAEQNLATARRLLEKGLGPRAQVETQELNVKRARFVLEKAQGKKTTLEKYTKEKMLKGLQGAVEKARGEELSRQAEVLRVQAVQDRLKKQIESCKVLAPVTGRLVYDASVEEGAAITQRQLLFRVIREEPPREAAAK